MSEILDLKKAVEDVMSSYERKIENIGFIFDATHLILSDFQVSILDTKEERKKINNQLRDILARNENLRKKDFDNIMMQSIFEPQGEREREARSLLNNYINEQKEILHVLRCNFPKVRDATTKSEIEKIKELSHTIKGLLSKQDKRKEELTSKLLELQKEQEEVVTRVKTLLIKGRELRIRDLKEMLTQIRLQRKERIAHQQGGQRKDTSYAEL